ncbi:MAG: hypothetical protein A2136_05485 [Chloroflexi bacterium RBG_16_54_11]|nr:MAG: hypothetical protein A2136_05485 [Chloroflexi bacterium RBG_16_54_11]
MIVRLFEGGTQRCITPSTSITRNAFNNYSYTLSTAEADAITDYSALEIHIQDSTLGSGETIDVSQLYLEVPNAPSIEESASLAKYAGISALGQASVQNTISQAKYLGVSSTGQVAMQEAASLGRSMGLSVSEEVGGGPTEESASLARFVGITVSENKVVYETVTLSMSLGIAENDQCIVGEAISLSRSAGQGSGDQANILEAVTLPRSDGLIAEGNLAGGATEESVTLSRLAGLSAGVSVNLNEAISLGYAKGIGQVEQLSVTLSVNLGKLLGVSETELGILYESVTLETNRGIEESSWMNIEAVIILVMIKTIQSHGMAGGKKQNKFSNLGLFLGFEEGMNT